MAEFEVLSSSSNSSSFNTNFNFQEYREKRKADYAATLEMRIELRGIDSDQQESDDREEETVEFLIKEEETIIQD